MASSPPGERLQVRQAKSRPLVDAFFLYCEQQRAQVLEGSPMWDALRYARNQEQALRRFVSNGQLPMHNNSSELALRRHVLGRRNWLFCDSDQGAEVNTIWVSLLASCHLHRIEPHSYLRDPLCLLPSWPAAQVLQLAPVFWSQTMQKPLTQQRLKDNLLRRVLLTDLHGWFRQPLRVAAALATCQGRGGPDGYSPGQSQGRQTDDWRTLRR